MHISLSLSLSMYMYIYIYIYIHMYIPSLPPTLPLPPSLSPLYIRIK